MGFVFISYSRKDQTIVNFIVSKLKDDGFDVWIDRENLKVGDHWQVRIVSAIKTTDAVVLMLSPNSAKSYNVSKEVDLAGGSERRFFPIVLAPVDVPDNFMFYLSGVQWIEFYLDPENKYRELVDALRAHQETVGVAPETRQVEVVLDPKTAKNFGKNEQNALIARLAAKAGTSPANVTLVRTTDDHRRAFFYLSAGAAYILATAALNRDKDLIRYGIEALRLDGEKDYVNLSRGAIGGLGPKPPRSILPRVLLMLMGAGVFLTTLITVALVFADKLSTVASTPTSTPTPSLTFTPALTATHTASATWTSIFTATASPSQTALPTVTSTASFTPSLTPTKTFTPTPTPILVTVELWHSISHEDNLTGTSLEWLMPGQFCGDVFEYDYRHIYYLGKIFSPDRNAYRPDNTVALYSWYNCSLGDARITTQWPGRTGDVRYDDYTGQPYQFIRLEGYIYSSEVDGTIQLNSWYSPQRGDYWVTTEHADEAGRTLLPDYEYRDLEGYVFP